MNDQPPPPPGLPQEPLLSPDSSTDASLPLPHDIASDSQASFSKVRQIADRIRQQIHSVLIGQGRVVDEVLASLMAGGHVLLEGKPGLGKTHLVLALANSFGGTFSRIQFTPDLMPSDVTGHTLYDMGTSSFNIRKGPVFANLLLADEINRAPAKTQAALLEVMQERQVTIDGERMPLDPPFMTLATQNPIEQEGTYPLPEAQLDRFLVKVLIDYPETTDEEEIVRRAAQGAGARGLTASDVEQVCTAEELMEAQRTCAACRCESELVSYAVRLVKATRDASAISLGAGTRGAISLIILAKAYAGLAGRDYVTADDVKQAALPVLRHRVQIAPEMAISGYGIDEILTSVIDGVEAPRGQGFA